MGSLHLVRHGQASFGTDNYDRLSPLGHRQCERLGQYLLAKGQRFDAVITGTLVRHDESYAAIARGLGLDLAPLRLPGLNEYDSEAVIATVHPGPLAKADTPEMFRQHFRTLREGLVGWMAGRLQPRGMPSYADFVAGVVAALDTVRQQHADQRVLIVSSGGPISTAVGQVLGTAPEVTIDLNMRIRNSAVTEFVVNPKRHLLLSYNTLPHLDGEEHADWVTYT
jgi:broad specificity phosphatase PhoE